MTAPPMTALIVIALLALLAAALYFRRVLSTLFGPVVFYDMICLARRGRYFILRMIYALVLVGMLVAVWLGVYVFSDNNMESHRRDVLLAQIYFGNFMFVQLFAISLLVPAYVAGAIADEKQRKTLEFILTTDLSNFEIVIGKLISRFANLVLFVLVGLPILSFLQFLGGIDPNLLLAGFAATFVTMVGLGGFSMLCSVLLKRPRDAIVYSFIGYLVYVLLGWVGYILQTAGAGFIHYQLWESLPTLSDVIDVCNAGNVLVSTFHVINAASAFNFEAALVTTLWKYALFHAVVGSICTALAVWRLRKMAVRHSAGTAHKTTWRNLRRSAVSDRPILWKELHVEQSRSWLGRLLTIALYTAVIGGGTAAVFVGVANGTLFDKNFTFGANVGVGLVGVGLVFVLLLSLSIRASGCISGEREKDTLDALQATPLDSDVILWEKFVGCMMSRLPLFILIGLVWVFGLIFGGLHIVDFAVMAYSLFAFTSAYTILGMWFSMASRSSARAILWTLLIYLATTFCSCYLLSPLHIFVYLPVLSYLIRHQTGDFGGGMEFNVTMLFMIGMLLISVIIYSGFVVLMWIFALKPRMRSMLLRTEREPRPVPKMFNQ